MSRFVKTILAIVFTISFGLGGLVASGFDAAPDKSNKEVQWQAEPNNFSNAVVAANLAAKPGEVSGTAIRQGLRTGDLGCVVARDYGTPSRAALNAAIAAIGSLERTMALTPGTWLIDDNLTVPANITLRVEQGAILALADAKTLTINKFSAGIYQVFDRSGSGAVVFNQGAAPAFYAEWFGAVGDGATDDSAAWNALNRAVPTGAKIVILNKCYAVNNVVFDKHDLELECQGYFKPKANRGFCVQIGHSSGGYTMNIRGSIRVNSKGNYHTWNSVDALRICNLYRSEIYVKEASGCHRGLFMFGDNPTAANGGCGYNKIHLGLLHNNKYNHFLTQFDEGWCNENQFFGGWFTWDSSVKVGNTEYNIYQTFNNTKHIPNNNTWFAPCFEGPGNFIYLNGYFNRVLLARSEDVSSTWAADKIYFGSKSKMCEVTLGMNDQLSTKFIPVAGGNYSTLNNVEFTVDQDVTQNVWTGAIVSVTVTGKATHKVPVAVASWDGSKTTIRLAKAIFTLRSAEATGLSYWPIKNTGASNSVEMYLGAPETFMRYRTDLLMGRFFQGGMFLKGDSSFWPALTLLVDGASANKQFSLLSSSAESLWINGLGDVHTKGTLATAKNSPPSDRDLAAGELALWFDSTNGAPKLRAKAKQADGTVVTFTLNQD